MGDRPRVGGHLERKWHFIDVRITRPAGRHSGVFWTSFRAGTLASVIGPSFPVQARRYGWYPPIAVRGGRGEKETEDPGEDSFAYHKKVGRGCLLSSGPARIYAPSIEMDPEWLLPDLKKSVAESFLADRGLVEGSFPSQSPSPSPPALCVNDWSLDGPVPDTRVLRPPWLWAAEPSPAERRARHSAGHVSTRRDSQPGPALLPDT